jgi:D-alanine-D-alanine ligase
VLEANSILTDTSLLPLAADAAGMAFDALVARILDLAVARAAARALPARLIGKGGLNASVK